MTELRRPVRRTVPGVERRGLVVTLYPNQTIGLRPKRTRTEHLVPLSRVYRLACELTAEARRQAREKDRAARRAARGLPPLVKKVRRGLLRP